MEEFTYEQIRVKALKQGAKDNKVHIGLWANLNNYLKTRRKKNGKIAMQCSKEGEYKIPGGGMEAGETYVEALAREVKEETGLFIIPEKAVGLGEILEVRKDIFDDTKKFICHSLFYYCEETGEETPIHLTKSEIAKGYYLKWATPQEIYDTNIAMEKDPWIIRDTAFIKMILDGKIAALQGIVTGTRYE